jgi:hypothetical protein
MRLLRIDDDAEQVWAETEGNAITVGQEYMWLGGSDLAVSEYWTWTDGDGFYQGLAGSGGGALDGLYTNFDPSDPNHGNVYERCVAMRPSTTAYWYDIDCSLPSAYLCEAY